MPPLEHSLRLCFDSLFRIMCFESKMDIWRLVLLRFFLISSECVQMQIVVIYCEHFFVCISSKNGKCARVCIEQIFLYWWFIMMLVYKASNGSSLWNANFYRVFFKAAMKTCLLVEYNHTEKDFMVMCSKYFLGTKIESPIMQLLFKENIQSQILHLFLELCLHLNIIVGWTNFSLKHLMYTK